MDLRYFPPVTAIIGLGRMLTGQVRFNRQRVGEMLVEENGEQHRVFREVRVDSRRSLPVEAPVVLKIRFKFGRFTPAVNRWFSLLPVPAIIGMPGFKKKTWTYCDETGYSQGIYRFESVEAAEAYRASPVVRILEKRTVPGSMEHTIVKEGDLK
jgi:hypothetical protein